MMRLVRGVLDSIVDGAIRRITATGRVGEGFANREFFQHYGFVSRPQAGAELILIGNDGAVFSIAEDDRRYRIAIEKGEVALYTDEGDKIVLQRGRKILVQSGGEVTVDAPAIKLGANAARRLIDERIIAWCASHTHTTTAPGSPTSPPTAPLLVETVATTVTRAS